MKEEYVTLMSALPHLGDLFSAKETPCSRYKLEGRLTMLNAQHARLLAEIENLLQWSFHPLCRTDTEIIALAHQLVPRLIEQSPLLGEVVTCRLERRTLIAALRRRKRGEPAPRPDVAWGYGRWLRHIVRYWNEPTFRLETIYPWLPTVERLLREDATIEIERLLLGSKWVYLGRMGEKHYFDFEAVVIYVLRWNIINRWCGYSGQVAAERFIRLMNEGFEKQAHT